jgi:hypothetical protein
MTINVLKLMRYLYNLKGGLKLKISTNTSRVVEEPKSPPAKESPPTPPPAPQPQLVKAATPATSPEKKPIAQSPSISRLRPRKKEDPKVGASSNVYQHDLDNNIILGVLFWSNFY